MPDKPKQKRPIFGLRKARQLARSKQVLSTADSKKIIGMIRTGVIRQAARNGEQLTELQIRNRIHDAAENIHRVRRRKGL